MWGNILSGNHVENIDTTNLESRFMHLEYVQEDSDFQKDTTTCSTVPASGRASRSSLDTRLPISVSKWNLSPGGRTTAEYELLLWKKIDVDTF